MLVLYLCLNKPQGSSDVSVFLLSIHHLVIVFLFLEWVVDEPPHPTPVIIFNLLSHNVTGCNVNEDQVFTFISLGKTAEGKVFLGTAGALPNGC